jgi:hypothetical protein
MNCAKSTAFSVPQSYSFHRQLGFGAMVKSWRGVASHIAQIMAICAHRPVIDMPAQVSKIP